MCWEFFIFSSFQPCNAGSWPQNDNEEIFFTILHYDVWRKRAPTIKKRMSVTY